jgi:hypothetical protein
MLPTKFQIIWPSSFRGEEFFKSANQKQASPVATMFVNGWGNEKNRNFIFITHFLAHLAKGNVSFCRRSSVNFSHFNLLL